jgi:hypothetical protein
MLQDLDNTLAALLLSELPPSLAQLGAAVSVTFDTPSTNPPFLGTSVSPPAVNLFLLELEENRDLRTTDPVIRRTANGRAKSLPAPVRVDCHYLVTAWVHPSSPAQEHLLLGETMRVLLRYPEIPAAVLVGSMVHQQVPIRTAVFNASRQQMRGDFWQALNGYPKAAFHYTVTICVDTDAAMDVGNVTTSVEVEVAPLPDPPNPLAVP